MRKYLFISILIILLISPLKVNARTFDDEVIRKSQLCVGDVCNKLDIIDGEYYLIENVAQITFDGSENWLLAPEGYFALFSTEIIASMVTNIDRSDFKNNLYSISRGYIIFNNLGDNLITINDLFFGNRKAVYLRDNQFSTVDQFKNYLSFNNLIITFVLETPIHTKINDTYLPSENVIFPNVFDFNISNVFYLLYNSMISMTMFVNSFWTWLTTNKVLNLSLPILGDIWGFEFTPLGVFSGVGLIALLTLWLIKRLVPVA